MSSRMSSALVIPWWIKQLCLEKTLTDVRTNLSPILELIEQQAMQVNKKRLELKENKEITMLKKSFKLTEVPADGNCMYNSVSAGLHGQEFSPAVLRNLTVVQMGEMRERVIEEVNCVLRTPAPSPADKWLTKELKSAADFSEDKKFNVYLAIHAEPGVFAEHLQIQALCEALGICVDVYSTRGEIMESFGGEPVNRKVVKLLLSILSPSCTL